MTIKEAVKRLNRLSQLDKITIKAYNEAIKKCKNTDKFYKNVYSHNNIGKAYAIVHGKIFYGKQYSIKEAEYIKTNLSKTAINLLGIHIFIEYTELIDLSSEFKRNLFIKNIDDYTKTRLLNIIRSVDIKKMGEEVYEFILDHIVRKYKLTYNDCKYIARSGCKTVYACNVIDIAEIINSDYYKLAKNCVYYYYNKDTKILYTSQYHSKLEKVLENLEDYIRYKNKNLNQTLDKINRTLTIIKENKDGIFSNIRTKRDNSKSTKSRKESNIVNIS